MAEQRTYIFLTEYLGRSNGKTRQFKKNDTVIGEALPLPPQPQGTMNIMAQMPMIKTTEGYIVPSSILRPVPIVDVPSENDVLTKAKTIAKTSAFKQGAVVGIVIGAGYGFFNNKSVFYSAIMGMLTGGIVGHVFFKVPK